MAEHRSVGIVQTRHWRFADPPNELALRSGVRLGPIDVAYETYGQLSPERDNAILICHALSGDAHVAGRHSADDRKAGWWDVMVGPGNGIDTDRYFVICPNCIGGCKGSTGPGSINPRTGKPYGLDFPMVTVSDMVKVQHALVSERLGLKKLLSVIGGSMGGMQVLQWAIDYPETVESAVPIASTSRLNAQGIAFHEVGRQAVYGDPNWHNGDYYDGTAPTRGLAVARMIGHVTYLSEHSMREKFGRGLQDRDEVGYDFGPADFQVESYLRYKGGSFVERFDANSYLYITKAMDYFDLVADHGSLIDAFRSVRGRFLVISHSGDWLFPTYQSKEIVRALQANRVVTTFCELGSEYGHDAFLLDDDQLRDTLREFLRNTQAAVRRRGSSRSRAPREAVAAKTEHSPPTAEGKT
ncbi:MAG: homoserine O-acetyltransferase [Candidatus Brocadiae bacterium]|nr:homoserine O-acetyltransferase [Candidatus Brocadiia bacterium]